MSLNPVYAGIAVSSLSWSFFDLSRKKLAVDLAPVPVVAWLMLFQGLIFLVLSLFDTWILPAPAYWAPFLTSVALNAFANIWYVESLSLAPFSLAVPILSLTPVFSATGGFLILGEQLSIKQIVGISIVVAATLGIGYFGAAGADQNAVGGEGSTGVDRRAIRKGLALTAIVALLFALTPVVDKLCLKAMPGLNEHGTLQCFATTACLAFWIRWRGGGVAFSRIRASGFWFLAATAFASSAVYFQFWSIQFISVGIFEALKRSSGLVAALVLGTFVFREAFTWTKLVLVGLMGAGIFVLLA